MTLQTIPLTALRPPPANPRQSFDQDALEGLAGSIRTDGVLQNLIVTPAGKGKGKRARYAIVSGERRFRALKLLAERGEIEADFAVPVEIREQLDDKDGLRLATVENVQREALAPLDEAAAFVRLLQDGAKLEDVAARTGLSETTVRRRVALGALCDQARDALREGEITLAQAEALTLGTHEDQQRIFENIEHGFSYDAEDIREILIESKPVVSMAVFPMERYTGTLTTDLFADAGTSYFDDAEQFFALQREAVESLVRKHEQDGAAWIEVTGYYRVPAWQYDEAGDGEPAGVVINLSPTGRVDVLTGLARREIDQQTKQETADNPAAKARPKAAYTTPLCRYFGWHKTAAVQKTLLANPRKAREIAVILMLQAARQSHGAFSPHEALRSFSAEDGRPDGYGHIEDEAQAVLRLLGGEAGDDPAWYELALSRRDPEDLYETLKGLENEDLDRIIGALSVLAFGQEDCNRLDARDSLFNRVACDLAVDMRDHWIPERSFLERRNKAQLIEIARACGYADGLSLINGFKKGELVTGMARFFAQAKAADKPTEAQQKALQWLPEAMAFPAVDPDASEAETEAAGEDSQPRDEAA